MEFDDSLDLTEDSEVKIARERDEIKEKINEKLKALNFDDKEIKSVLSIIDAAEAKISAIKSTLLGTNINTDDPETPVMLAKVEINKIQLEMAKQMQEKIAEIEASKKA